MLLVGKNGIIRTTAYLFLNGVSELPTVQRLVTATIFLRFFLIVTKYLATSHPKQYIMTTFA